jgi:hypothetical protein
MKRSSQVGLLLAGVTAAGVSAYSMMGPDDCNTQERPATVAGVPNQQQSGCSSSSRSSNSSHSSGRSSSSSNDHASSHSSSSSSTHASLGGSGTSWGGFGSIGHAFSSSGS